MLFIRLLAFRYLFSRTNLSSTRWISIISAVAIGVVTAALVCVLSVYNGYTRMILSTDNESSAEYVITDKDGKIFSASPLAQQLKKISIPLSKSQILSSQGILQSSGENFPVEITGIDSSYLSIIPLYKHIQQGYLLRFMNQDSLPEALIGIGLAQHGALNQTADNMPRLIFPKREGFINPLAPASAFEERPIRISGILMPLSEEVNQQVYADINVVRELLHLPDDAVSAILIHPTSTTSESEVRTALSPALGNQFKLLNREEQQPARTFLIRSEKIMVYLIMIFILVLAAFNLASSLVMLIIEKRQTIFSLRAIGATPQQITLIFTTTGLLTSLVGSIAGLCLGTFICLLQEHFALLYTGDGASRIPFPVDLQLPDIVLILIITAIISLVSASLPNLFLRNLFTKK